jgi:hypothetical protein
MEWTGAKVRVECRGARVSDAVAPYSAAAAAAAVAAAAGWLAGTAAG